MTAEEARVGTAMALTAYGLPLETIHSFKYFERILSASDDDWPEVV